ncbi:MAG: hypothetical protein WCT05_08330 [Lentisphaeria bacterium]
MNRFDNLLKEWEKTLLLITAAGSALFFLILLWPADQEGNISQSGTLPAIPNYVQTDTMAFLQPVQMEKNVNPMAFRRKMSVRDKPENKLPPKGNNNDNVATVKTPPPVDKGKPVPPTPPIKKTPPRIITLTYRGLYKGLQNAELAFIRATDSAENNTTITNSLPVGEKFHDLFTIVSFDEHNLTLQDPDQKTIILMRNKDTKVTIE